MERDVKQRLVRSDSAGWQHRRLVGGRNGLQRVAGVDISFINGDDVNACACVVVLSLPDLKVRNLTTTVKVSSFVEPRISYH